MSKRKTGRPPITEVFMSAEDIAKEYEKWHSMRKTAKVLGIGVRTVFKYVNEASTPIKAGREFFEDGLVVLNARPIAKELAKLPQPIPRSLRYLEVALDHRFSRENIRWFLRSRAKACKENIQRKGSLCAKLPIVLRDVYGRMINTGMIEMYQVRVDLYNLVVTIDATLKFGGKVTFRLSYDALMKLLSREPPLECPPNNTH